MKYVIGFLFGTVFGAIGMYLQMKEVFEVSDFITANERRKNQDEELEGKEIAKANTGDSGAYLPIPELEDEPNIEEIIKEN